MKIEDGKKITFYIMLILGVLGAGTLAYMIMIAQQFPGPANVEYVLVCLGLVLATGVSISNAADLLQLELFKR